MILSYRTMLVAIVSRSSFVFVSMGYRASTTRYVAECGFARTPGGGSHSFSGSAEPTEKAKRDMSWRPGYGWIRGQISKH